MENKINIIRAAFLFLFLGIFTVSGFSQDKPMITVLPFQAIEVPEHVSRIITQLFETNIVNTGAYEVLSQNERDQILAAQAESISGCTDESCALEIGRLLAAEQIVLGTVATLGTKYIINAKVIDVTTSKTLGADMISAASVEDLDTACAKLTKSLVEKALPDIKIAEEAEPEIKPEPVIIEEEKPEPVIIEEEKAEPVKAVKEVKPVKPGQFNLPAYLSFAAGTVLTGAGNITGGISFETRLKSLDVWAAYMAAEGDAANSLYWNADQNSYSDLYEKYKINSITAYSTWGLGGAALTAAPFLGDSYLSGGGKLTLAGGVLLNTAGNVFAMLSSKNALAVKKLYAEYMNTEGDAASEAYDKYEDAYDGYNIKKTAGYGLWGVGTALQIGSYLIPGNKKPVNSSFIQKLLTGAGSVLFAGGSYTSALSMNAFINAQSAWQDYITAGEAAAADLYNTYENKWGVYTKLGYTSYGLWAGGGLAYIAALFLPSGDSSEQTAQWPVSLNIKPALTGLGAEVNIKL